MNSKIKKLVLVNFVFAVVFTAVYARPSPKNELSLWTDTAPAKKRLQNM
jgi:hypothetical protein